MLLPRVAHRLWLGGQEPRWTENFAATWEQPGWAVRHWGDETVSELFPLANQDIFDRAEELAPNHVGQLRSDVLRYELLYRFGGVWVDVDLECLRPIDPLLKDVECFAAWEVQYRWIGNTILGCIPGHPAMKALIDGLPRNVRRRAGSRPNKLSGPQFVSRVLKTRRDVEVFDQGMFYPYSWSQIKQHGPGERFPGAYAVHHWNNRRRETGILARS